MTKEEFIEKLVFRTSPNSETRSDLLGEINEFFDSNICIPKGETLQALIGGSYEDICTIAYISQYRIKPSEPIYEWQWYRFTGSKVYFNSDKFYTDDEAKSWNNSEYKKFVETKQERK